MPSDGLQKENLYVTESAGFRGTPCLSTPNLITHRKNNNNKKKIKLHRETLYNKEIIIFALYNVTLYKYFAEASISEEA